MLRPPTSNWENTSCCNCVVPSQCAADGGCGTPFVVDTLAPGLYGAIHGPMTARTRKRPSVTRPKMIFGDFGSLTRRPRSRRVRTAAGGGGLAAGGAPSALAAPKSVMADML